MTRIFFYGLFMDTGLLRDKGLHPVLIGPAELPGYQIRIGNRASLVPNAESTAYGMLIDLPASEASRLYSAPDVSDYRPEQVTAILLSDRKREAALCFNLPAEQLGAKTNTAYAEKLSTLVRALGFPSSYADELQARP